MMLGQGPFPPAGPQRGGRGGRPRHRGPGGPGAGFYPVHPTDVSFPPSFGPNNPQQAPPTWSGPGMPQFGPAMDMMAGNIMALPSPVWVPQESGNMLMPPAPMFNQNEVFGPVNPMAPGLVVPFDPSSDPPFIDRTVLHQPRAYGVIRIKNIPFALTVSEVHQFICKYVHADDLIKPHQDGYPIHIVMERSTGKTMDCYVEIVSPEVAAEAWERGFSYGPCRYPKLGQRHVVVELSNQAELMRDLFPRARSVVWDQGKQGVPTTAQVIDPYSSGFAGFFTAEEMGGVVRHAENPQRSPFASRNLQRTYESTISTLYKFPWSTTSMYTMNQRDILFKTYARQLEILAYKVERETHLGADREVGLDVKLLMDFLFAGMNCPGFSERQKAAIADCSRQVGPGFGPSVHARNWPFQALGPHPITLPDQEIAMWFEVLNLGMVEMERDNPQTIGIPPNLKVVRDNKGYILFTYTEAGGQLPRAQYAALEKRFMEKMMHKGWISYMHQSGIALPPGFEEDFQVSTDDAADNDNGIAGEDQVITKLGQSGEATNKAIESFAELLKVTHGEEYVKAMGDNASDNTAKLFTPEQKDSASLGTDFGPKLLHGETKGSPGKPHDEHHSHRQSLSYVSKTPGKKYVGLSPPLDLERLPHSEPKQVYRKTQRHLSDSALDSAFSGLNIGGEHFGLSPPRVTTARKGSPVLQGSSNASTVTSGVFEVPRRERRAVSIRAPDGTAVPLPNQAEAGTSVGFSPNVANGSGALNTPQSSKSGTPVSEPSPTSKPATPHGSGANGRLTNTASNNTGSGARAIVQTNGGNRKLNPSPVIKAKVGVPSPGHARNYGIGATPTFGASSASTTPASGRRMVAESGSPLERGTGKSSGAKPGTSGSNTDSFRPTARGRARSAFAGFGEPINEEEWEEVEGQVRRGRARG
ncbi:hypothetical protein KCU88_g1295, partial [Aureobasidium melanogenum]